MRRHSNLVLLFLAIAMLGCGGSTPVPVKDVGLVGKAAPELAEALTWVNSAPLRLAELRGKVVVLQFFEYSSMNCLRTFPYLKEWQRRYEGRGLKTVMVHSPQYGFSMDPKYVFAGTSRLGLAFPIAVDSELKIAQAYEHRLWPRTLVVDREGIVRFDHSGEGGYTEAELTIQKLLGVQQPTMSPVRSSDKPGATCYRITDGLNLGQTHGKLGNIGVAEKTGPVTMRLPGTLTEGAVFAAGEWANEEEYLRHTRDADPMEDCVALKYRATEVNVVMKPEGIYWLQVFVQQGGRWLPKQIAGEDVQYDAEGRSFVKVNMPRLYNLIAQQSYGTYELRLYVSGKGLSVYSFSFGTCEVSRDEKDLVSSPAPKS